MVYLDHTWVKFYPRMVYLDHAWSKYNHVII
jgi:hypothetical protein